MRKRMISLVLVWSLCCMLVFPDITIAQANNISDIKGHWGEKEIERWASYGYISGYQDGSFKPDQPITTAEFVAIVNKVLGLQEKSSENFPGIKSNDWFSEAFARAKHEGYLKGCGEGPVNPKSFITRQEVMVIISNLLRDTKAENPDVLYSLKDAAQISEWGKTAVSEAVRRGYAASYPDGTFRPAAFMSRAEAVAVLNRAFGTIVREKGSIGSESVKTTIKGNVTITSPGIIVQNAVIEGDLYCTAGVGEGEVIIKDSIVKGKTIISGGGKNSVIFINTSSKKLVVYKHSGTVRILAKGATSLNNTVLETSAILEEAVTGGRGFDDLEIITINPGDRIELNGSFKKVLVKSPATVEITGATTVGSFQVGEDAGGTLINIGGQASVSNMRLDSGVQITGNGRIDTVGINANGVSIGTPVRKLIVGKSVASAIVGNREFKKPGEYILIEDSPGGSKSSRDDREDRGTGGSANGNVNNAPTAADDNVIMNEDGSTLIPVLGNDSDPDGDAVSIAAFTQGSHGMVELTAGSLKYTPGVNYNGADSFTYTITDGRGGTATATVTVTVNAVNDMPSLVNDNVAVNEDDTTLADVLVNDSDIDGDSLSITIFTQGGHGTVIKEGSGFRYTPVQDWNGNDSFQYTVSDGHGGTAVATVIVTVNPANDAPVADDDIATVAEDDAVLIAVLDNDNDIDGDHLSVSAYTQGNHGVVFLAGDQLRYTPAANYSGPDGFTYTVSDSNGGSATATVSVTVNAVADAPTAVDDTAVVDEDDTVLIDVLDNDHDIDGGSLSIFSYTQGSKGTVVQEVYFLRYAPGPDYNGSDIFTYEISDGQGVPVAATVRVTVNPRNDAPTAVDDAAIVNEDSTVLIDVLANDSDIDGDSISIDTFNTVGHGVVIKEGSSLRYTPVPNWSGIGGFSYTVTDGKGGTATATVTVTVNAVNDAPVAVNDAAVVNMDNTVLINVLANDSDIEGDSLSVTIYTHGSHGTVTKEDSGLRYAPLPGWYGTDSFDYTVSDGKGGTATATVTVTVSQLYGGVYQLATAASATVLGGMDIPFSSNGPLNDINHTAGTTKIIVAKAGVYKIDYNVSITAGIGSQIAIAVNGAVDPSTCKTALVSTGEVSGSAMLTLAADDFITLRNNSAVSMTMALAPSVGAQVSILKVSGSSGSTYQLATIADATVIGGADVPFSKNGPLNDMSHTAGTTTITVTEAGTYKIDYNVSITAGIGSQIGIAVNGAVDPSTCKSAFVSTGAISGSAVLTLAAGDAITLRNNSAVPMVMALAPSVGAQVSILKVSGSSGNAYQLANIADATVFGGADIPFSNNGPLDGMTYTAGTTTITVVKAGVYKIDYNVSITAGIGSQIGIAVNGTVDSSTCKSALVATGDISGSTMLTLAAGDVITLRNNSAVPMVMALAPSVGAQVNLLKVK